MNIYAYNPDVEDLEKTYLSLGVAATGTILKVKNTNLFANTRKVLVGAPARERSEMVTQTAKTSTQLTVSALSFNHDSDDPVYSLQYDQVKFYRSTAGENGTYSLLTTQDIDWDNADGRTRYDDVNALSTYWYKVSFYDSLAAIETPQSPAIQSTGFAPDTTGAVIMDVATWVKDRDFATVSIDEWLSVMNDVNDDLTTRAKKPYRFLKMSPLINVTAGDFSFPYPADIWNIDYVEVNTTNIAYPRKPKEVSPVDFRYRQSYNEAAADWVRYISYDDEEDQVLFWPAARTDRIGAFTFHYYRTFTRYTSLSDKLQTPNGLVYKLAMKREHYLSLADSDSKYLTKAKDYDNRYEAEVMKLQREKNIKANGVKGLYPDVKRYRQ